MKLTLFSRKQVLSFTRADRNRYKTYPFQRNRHLFLHPKSDGCSCKCISQLGLKIQHSLRAFTAVDRKVIKQTAENYPETTFYKTEDLITQLGIGEALVTLLNEKGIPTPLGSYHDVCSQKPDGCFDRYRNRCNLGKFKVGSEI